MLYLARYDYDAALQVNPRLAAALYGRGVVKQATGDKSGGAADIKAAQQIDPLVALRSASRQLSPDVASGPVAG